MKIKLDENLPARLAIALVELGHDTDTGPQQGLTGRPDHEVWAAAQADERFLITQDLDFSDIRRYRPGTHCGLLLVRLRDADAGGILARLRDVFETEDVDAWTQCFVVVTNHRIRVSKPGE